MKNYMRDEVPEKSSIIIDGKDQYTFTLVYINTPHTQTHRYIYIYIYIYIYKWIDYFHLVRFNKICHFNTHKHTHIYIYIFQGMHEIGSIGLVCFGRGDRSGRKIDSEVLKSEVSFWRTCGTLVLHSSVISLSKKCVWFYANISH